MKRTAPSANALQSHLSVRREHFGGGAQAPTPRRGRGPKQAQSRQLGTLRTGLGAGPQIFTFPPCLTCRTKSTHKRVGFTQSAQLHLPSVCPAATWTRLASPLAPTWTGRLPARPPPCSRPCRPSPPSGQTWPDPNQVTEFPRLQSSNDLRHPNASRNLHPLPLCWAPATPKPAGHGTPQCPPLPSSELLPISHDDSFLTPILACPPWRLPGPLYGNTSPCRDCPPPPPRPQRILPHLINSTVFITIGNYSCIYTLFLST